MCVVCVCVVWCLCVMGGGGRGELSCVERSPWMCCRTERESNVKLHVDSLKLLINKELSLDVIFNFFLER